MIAKATSVSLEGPVFWPVQSPLRIAEARKELLQSVLHDTTKSRTFPSIPQPGWASASAQHPAVVMRIEMPIMRNNVRRPTTKKMSACFNGGPKLSTFSPQRRTQDSRRQSPGGGEEAKLQRISFSQKKMEHAAQKCSLALESKCSPEEDKAVQKPAWNQGLEMTFPWALYVHAPSFQQTQKQTRREALEQVQAVAYRLNRVLRSSHSPTHEDSPGSDQPPAGHPRHRYSTLKSLKSPSSPHTEPSRSASNSSCNSANMEPFAKGISGHNTPEVEGRMKPLSASRPLLAPRKPLRLPTQDPPTVLVEGKEQEPSVLHDQRDSGPEEEGRQALLKQRSSLTSERHRNAKGRRYTSSNDRDLTKIAAQIEQLAIGHLHK
jgi:hypothetical protein